MNTKAKKFWDDKAVAYFDAAFKYDSLAAALELDLATEINPGIKAVTQKLMTNTRVLAQAYMDNGNLLIELWAAKQNALEDLGPTTNKLSDSNG